MKATLEFNLPEEQAEFEHAVRGREFYCALDDIKQAIRSALKYSDPKDPELLEKLRDLIPLNME